MLHGKVVFFNPILPASAGVGPLSFRDHRKIMATRSRDTFKFGNAKCSGLDPLEPCCREQHFVG
eukprot:6026887-Amphidinium_carterae.1